MIARTVPHEEVVGASLENGHVPRGGCARIVRKWSGTARMFGFFKFCLASEVNVSCKTHTMLPG